MMSNRKRISKDVDDDDDGIEYPQWHNAVAGASAGAGARIFTTPLDIIRIRRQLAPTATCPTTGAPVHCHTVNENLVRSMYTIFQNGGTVALFRGNVAAMNLWVGYSAVQFALYARCKDFLTDHLHVRKQQQFLRNKFKLNNRTSLQRRATAVLETTASGQNNNAMLIAFVSGAFAGSVATLLTYPFDICRTTFAARCVHDYDHTALLESSCAKTRAKAEAQAAAAKAKNAATASASASASANQNNRPPKTIYEFMINVIRQKGYRGLFIGCSPAILQIIPYMGLNFAIYDTLTTGDNRVDHSGLAGSISGATSKVIVYPIDTVKKRMQAQAFFGSLNPSYHYKGVMDCFVTVFKEEGIMAFYKGLVPSVLKTTLASGLSFAIYRFTKNTLQNLHNNSHHHISNYRNHVTSTTETKAEPSLQATSSSSVVINKRQTKV